MTPRQAMALRHPCFSARDTLDARYTEALIDNRLRDKVSTTLTIVLSESFDDEPTWMASAAIAHGNERHPIPYSAWTKIQRRRARKRLLDLLDGVGTGPTYLERIRSPESPGYFALHAKRQLRSSEAVQLPREFLIAPPWPPSGVEPEREIIDG